jgi:hypothetical protein
MTLLNCFPKSACSSTNIATAEPEQTHRNPSRSSTTRRSPSRPRDNTHRTTSDRYPARPRSPTQHSLTTSDTPLKHRHNHRYHQQQHQDRPHATNLARETFEWVDMPSTEQPDYPIRKSRNTRAT